MKHTFEVIVGNIGTVYSGNSAKEAASAYNDYVRMSKGNVGRAAGEEVTMFKGGDICREHAGKRSEE